MPFTAKDWQDSPSTTSPITAAALEDMETRVTDYAEAIAPRVHFKQFSNLTFDGSTDVATAINSALTSLAASGGGILVLPASTSAGVLSAPIVLQPRTGLVGQGMFATTLRLANAVNDNIIENYVSPDGTAGNAEFTSVRHLRLDGNKTNQSSGAGIYFDAYPSATAASGDDDYDPHHLVENVMIYNVKGNGFEAISRSETRLQNVYTYKCDGYGFKPSYDSFLSLCTAACY